MDGIEVCCPYCSHVFETGRPVRSEKANARNHPVVESLPYTRDIGRFDPKSARERTSPDGWTQVCRDFMTFLGFHRIGILRQEPGQPVDVMYRVQYCPNCKRLFDVYANYTRGHSLAQIWPHLFAEDPDRMEMIRRYDGISWPIWIAEELARRLHLRKKEYGALLLGLLVFLIGFLPWLFRQGWPQAVQETSSLWMTFITYTVAAAGIIALLILLERFVRKMQENDDFYDLFRSSHQRGVSYWYNYTLCRFVGVQAKGRLPQISQVEVWGSGLALLSLVLVWVATHAQHINFLALLGVAAGFMAFVWLLRRIFKKLKRQTVTFVTVGLFILTLGVVLIGPERMEVLALFAEVVFWAAFAYIAGMSAWVAMSATLYVLKGVTRVPMHINPLTQFKELKPLLSIQQFSTSVMAVLFVTLISLVFLLEIFSNTLPHLSWMVYWLQLALAVLFAAIAVGLRPAFLLITAAYLVLNVYFYTTPALPTIFNVPLDLVQVNLIVFGVFLTFIMYFHLHEGRTYIDKIVAIEKEAVLDEIDGQINKLRAYAVLTSQDEAYSKDKNQFFEYTQGLHGLDALLNLRKTIQAAQFRSVSFAARVVGPLLWSIVLPSIWDLFTQFLIDRWIQ